MATVPFINTSVVATSTSDAATSPTTASPGCLPSTMTCWEPSHPRHIWPSTPGSTLRIEACELYCFYCSENGNEGKWYSKASTLRVHILEAHLMEGPLKGVQLRRGESNGKIFSKRRHQSKKTKRLSLPDRTLDPQVQLSHLTHTFSLSPEHHASFQRLIKVFFADKTSNLEQAVASFLRTYGPALWPDAPEMRRHLLGPETPASASHFRTMTNPTYNVHGKMTKSARRLFLTESEGREPTGLETILMSPLGKAMQRYVKLLDELGELGITSEMSKDGLKELLVEILGCRDGMLDGLEDVNFQEYRQSSPDVPLRVASKKRKRSTEHQQRDSSPEVALATASRSRRPTEVEGGIEPSLAVLLSDMVDNTREEPPVIEASAHDIRFDTTIPYDLPDVSTVAATTTAPLQIKTPRQRSIQNLSGQAEQLPLWDEFLRSAEHRGDNNDILQSDVGVDGGTQLDVSGDDLHRPRSHDTGQELRASTVYTREISPRSRFFSAQEQPTQTSAMPVGGFCTSSNPSTHGSTEQQSFSQWTRSVNDVPTALSRRPIAASSYLRGSTRPAAPGDVSILGNSTSMLPPPVTQPLHASWIHSRHQRFGSATTQANIRRDPIVWDASLSQNWSSPSAYFAPATTIMNDPYRRSMEHTPSHLLTTTERVCLPGAAPAAFELPTAANTIDQGIAVFGSSDPTLHDLTIQHHAKLEMYRRETGYMGGLPVGMP